MVSVINTVDTSHEDMIHDAQVDYYGARLATCSSDKSVRIFDVRTAQHILIADLKGHDGPVWQLAWAHPMYGSVLATCGYDKKVIIWKEKEGIWLKLTEHSHHESSVNSVCWAPYEYGLILASGSSDGSIIFLYSTGTEEWETKKITTAHSTGCNAVSWASSIQPCLSSVDDQTSKLSSKRLVSGGCDNLVKIWREEDGEWLEEQRLDAHSDWVRDVAWAPSLSLMRSVLASCSQDQQVFIWMNDGSGWTSKLLHKFNDVVWHLSWSITGNILAVSGGDNKVSLWKENVEGQWSCISNVGKGLSDI